MNGSDEGKAGGSDEGAAEKGFQSGQIQCPYCGGKGSIMGRDAAVMCPKCSGRKTVPKIETK